MIIQDIQLMKSLADLSQEQETEKLKGVLAHSFEAALDEGLSPQDAIAVILAWAAEECTRLREQ
jgi:hypothetical protein